MKVTWISVSLALAFASPMSAQVNKSNLSGVVKDTTGAVVARAAVKLTNSDTGVSRAEVSDDTGLYRFLLVDLGTYRLEITAPGFKKFSRDGIVLQAGETITADATLQLGEVTESISVTGEASLLRTETAALGTTVNTRAITELPLQGRNPYVFLSLSAGIQYTGDPGNLNPWDVSGPSSFAASGSKARSEFLLDGVPNMAINNVSFSPSPDAVGEMRVQTNAYDAEYGHSGSAFVNVSTKSGTNQIHGNAYEYLQNDFLNAPTFFDNLNNRPKSIKRQNTFGGGVGAPIYLPKIYKGRNRTFFFVNYEGTRRPSLSTSSIVVPTLLERKGDFSKTVDGQGRAITIDDPASITNGVRSAFPGNVIPQNRWDAIGAKILNLYPEPNVTPAAGTLQNYLDSRYRTFTWNSFTTRVDENITATQQLFFRAGWNHRVDGGAAYFPNTNLFASGADIFERGNIAGGMGWTWIKSARTVVDVRVGFTRYNDRNYMFTEGMDLVAFGFPASFGKSVKSTIFPTTKFSDTQSLGTQTPNRTFINQFNPIVNVHSNYGRHALKYGFRYTVQQLHSINAASTDINNFNNRPGGYFSFDRAFTQGPNPAQASALAGYSTASLLLGLPSFGSAEIDVDPAFNTKFFSLYAQDDWKVSDRLTINLGLRAEHEGPTTDRFNAGVSGLDPNVASPLEAAAKANYAKNPIPELAALNVKGGLGFLNTNGAPRGNLSMPAVMWAPRAGFAYRVATFMVWRGGYGVFYAPNNQSNFFQSGFSLPTLMVTSLDNNVTPFNRLSDPFPNGLSQPLGAKGGLLTAVGQSVTAPFASIGSVRKFKDGLSQQFSMGFQFALPWQISLEIGYVGNRSQHLTINNRVDNDIPNQYLALKTRLNTQVANPFFGVVTDPTSALSKATVSIQQLLRPYPQFVNVTESALPYGRSNYDSLQIQITKRLQHGLQLGAAYTVSRFFEQVAYLNSNDPKPEHVISDSDRPQHLVINGLYELPFGPGQPFLNFHNGIAKRILGGWQINAIATFQSGQALAFSGADRVKDSNADPHTIDQWFDKTQFTPQQAFTLKTLSGRVADIRGPGINKIDLTLMKRIQIRERAALQIQAEAYNAFNHPNFDNPNTSVTSTTFGRITAVLLQPRNVQLSGRITW
ncbi:MAG TPA: TonB-dependent receptor [Candidatus Solibacter sp.]|nr:TonB-dependent receptor [Candidatus Solibacter sp.]